MKKGIIGKKLGMTQIFDEKGNVIPVTLIEAGPCVVAQKKTVENDGYAALQLAYEDAKEKHLTKAEKGHFAKADTAAKKYLTERVQGQCISQEFASGKRQTRRSIFEYTYQDKVYRRCENTYANKGYAKVGEVRELMIAPENPGCIYDPIAGKARKIGGITIGMIFFVLIAVILVSVYING